MNCISLEQKVHSYNLHRQRHKKSSKYRWNSTTTKKRCHPFNRGGTTPSCPLTTRMLSTVEADALPTCWEEKAPRASDLAGPLSNRTSHMTLWWTSCEYKHRWIQKITDDQTLTSSPKCFMAYSRTPDAASGCCSLLLMLRQTRPKHTLDSFHIQHGNTTQRQLSRVAWSVVKVMDGSWDHTYIYAYNQSWWNRRNRIQALLSLCDWWVWTSTCWWPRKIFRSCWTCCSHVKTTSWAVVLS